MTHQDQTQMLTMRAALGRGFGLISRLVRMHPWAFVSAVAGAGLFVSAIVASAVVIGNLADGLIVKVLDEGASTRGRLWPAVLAVIGVASWKAVGIVLRRSAAGWVQYRTQKDVRMRLIDHMLRLELSWFRRQSVGDLLAVTDSDASQATFILAPLPYATGSLLLLLGTVVTVAFLDPVMALVAALAIVVLSATDVHGSWKTFTAFASVQDARGRVARTAHESFDGAVTVKALGREAHETARFRDISEQLRDHIAHINRIWNIYRVVVQGMLSVATVLLLVVGAIRISAGALTPGELITIAYLFTLLYIPIIIIGFVVWDMAHSVAAWDRVQTVLDAEDLVPYGAIGPRSDGSPASVASDTVGFAYDERKNVITTLDMTIPPGRTVAIVGPTASGKSTLVTLLARLWDPTSGRIAIDGRDLREFARSALPAEVAFVAQETFLFDDTVRGNIGFGATAKDADIEAAASLAGADDFIRELPHGYDTLLGERGATLSGGERQRIAIARALVRRPRLLILDDATSAVDPSVETRILQGLKNADLPSTVILVAYRRSSITLADEVVYLENGRIVAHGSHEDLLNEPGYALLLEAYDEDAAIRKGDAGR